jgi:hypothetical protein
MARQFGLEARGNLAELLKLEKQHSMRYRWP